jgi:hypothetical protein
MYSNQLDFVLFTDEQLNTSLVKLKKERMKLIDTDPVQYNRLLHLSTKLEDAINARAKATPLTQQYFVDLCGL